MMEVSLKAVAGVMFAAVTLLAIYTAIPEPAPIYVMTSRTQTTCR